MVPFTSSIDEDQHVVLRAMAWQDFEALLAIRGDRAGVRMYYLDGEIELASSTRIHEERKTTLARLLELARPCARCGTRCARRSAAADHLILSIQ